MTSLFNFERLEDRKLLAAGATQRGGTLTINGTNGDDNIAIWTDDPGVVNVYDYNTGLSSVFTNVTNVKVNGKGGDDYLDVYSLEITGKLTVNGGSGEDWVNLDYADIDCKVSIDMGSDNDYVSYFGTNFDNNVSINLGSGDDLSEGAYAEFEGTLKINAGSGDDAVIHGLYYDYEWEEFFGNDYWNDVTVNLGSGDDYYQEVDGSIVGDLSSNGGTGFDVFSDGGTFVYGNTKFRNYEEIAD